MSRRCGVPLACCCGSGVFFSAPSPRGNGRFSIDGAVSSITVRPYSCPGSIVACGFLRCRVSFWPTSFGHQVVRKESGFRLHSRKGVNTLVTAMMFCSLKPWLVWLAKESRLDADLHISAIEDVWPRGVVAVLLDEVCARNVRSGFRLHSPKSVSSD